MLQSPAVVACWFFCVFRPHQDIRPGFSCSRTRGTDHQRTGGDGRVHGWVNLAEPQICEGDFLLQILLFLQHQRWWKTSATRSAQTGGRWAACCTRWLRASRPFSKGKRRSRGRKWRSWWGRWRRNTLASSPRTPSPSARWWVDNLEDESSRTFRDPDLKVKKTAPMSSWTLSLFSRPLAPGQRSQGEIRLPGQRSLRGQSSSHFPIHQLQTSGGRHAGAAFYSWRECLQFKRKLSKTSAHKDLKLRLTFRSLCVPASGNLLQRRAGHRAVLHGQRRRSGAQRRVFLQQSVHRQRLHPLAERGELLKKSQKARVPWRSLRDKLCLHPADDRDRLLRRVERLLSGWDGSAWPGLERAALAAAEAGPPTAAVWPTGQWTRWHRQPTHVDTASF